MGRGSVRGLGPRASLTKPSGRPGVGSAGERERALASRRRMKSGRAKKVAIAAVVVVVGLGAILTAVPGSPVQRLFYQTFRGQEVVLAHSSEPSSNGAGASAAPSAETGATAEAGASEQPSPVPTPRTVRIITVLPKNAIPAILDPRFASAEEAESLMLPSERVIGLSINGDHRAYSVPALSRHEVANDVVGGVPVAVTW